MTHCEPGTKHDHGKPRYELIPAEALREVAIVMTGGAEKYSDHNWKTLDNLQGRYYSACLRHMEADRMGQRLDDEFDCHHLAHAICCLLFKLQDRLDNGK